MKWKKFSRDFKSWQDRYVARVTAKIKECLTQRSPWLERFEGATIMKKTTETYAEVTATTRAGKIIAKGLPAGGKLVMIFDVPYFIHPESEPVNLKTAIERAMGRHVRVDSTWSSTL